MLESAGWQNETWPAEFRERVQAANSTQEAFEIMDELVCRLNDYHTRLSWPGGPRLASPPFRVEPVLADATAPADHGIWGQAHPPVEMPALKGVGIAVVQAATNCGVRPGDEIISVDGIPVTEALAKAWRRAVCTSVAGKLRSAAGRMLQGPPDAELHLKIRRQAQATGEPLEGAVKRSRSPAEPTISKQELDGVPLIRISRWTSRPGDDLVAQFDDLLNQYRHRPALVIDVRGNGGGEDDLASKIVGRFLTAPVIASISFHRQVPGLTFERTVDWTKPRGPWRYEGRVAVLTDEGCMSATEHFVSGMAEAGALLCGTPTSGACGWIRRVQLPGGATLNVSQTFPLHTGGIPSPELGIAPHLWAVRTLSDLQVGNDTALRAALAWLNSTSPLPVRVQPMSNFSGTR
jgi:C-terminal processing protease CtpA/Prc